MTTRKKPGPAPMDPLLKKVPTQFKLHPSTKRWLSSQPETNTTLVEEGIKLLRESRE